MWRNARPRDAVAAYHDGHALGCIQGLRERFAALDRDPKTARLERRLGELQQRLSDGKGGVRNAEDLNAISHEHQLARYRCQ